MTHISIPLPSACVPALSTQIPVAVRHLNSIIRMSEAHAKMHMRDHVRDDDVNVAISVMLYSFLQAQKFSVRTSLERGFRKYITQTSDFNELLMAELQKLMKDAETYARLRRAGPIDEYVDIHNLVHDLVRVGVDVVCLSQPSAHRHVRAGFT